MFTLNRAEWLESLSELSNRQLLKEYRALAERCHDIAGVRERGSRFYLGDPAFPQLLDTQRGLGIAGELLVKRGYDLHKVNKRQPKKPTV